MYRRDLHGLLEPAAKAVGYELLGCEFISQGKYSILRVYIDGPHGIDVNDCELASRQMSALLDVEDPIKAEYCLEVSSPGLERPLFTIAQYQQAQGQIVKVSLRTPVTEHRKLCGTIEKVGADNIILHDGKKEFKVLLVNIAKAHLVYREGKDR